MLGRSFGKERGWWAVAAALAATLATAPAAFAISPATVNVETDTFDGVCDANCSLRDAFDDVDAGGTINFTAGTDPTLTTGDIAIGAPVTIDGNGVAATSITGPAADRIFTVGNVAVTISDLTLTGGNAPSGVAGAPGTDGENGGAILNTGDLHAQRVRFYFNVAGYGGGAATINDNPGVGGSGGAISNEGTGELEVDQSTFEVNSAGGGEHAKRSGSHRRGNRGRGGAIANTGTSLLIHDSTFKQNGGGGGGVGPLSGLAGGPGGALYSTSPASVINSTLNDNFGGGGSPMVMNGGEGGAIYATASVTVVSTTIAGNRVGFSGMGGGNFGSALGGGISGSPGTVSLRNTILADNVASAAAGANCKSGVVTDAGGVLVSPADSDCPATFTVGDPDLEALANNGGPTNTMALGADSDAIDLVPAGTCTDLMAATLTVDQRGTLRPNGPRCDAGAFEGISPFIPTPPATQTTTPPATAATTPPAAQKKCKKGRKLKKGRCVKKKKRK